MRRTVSVILSLLLAAVFLFNAAALHTYAAQPSAAAASAPFILTPDEQVYLDSLRGTPIVIAYSYDLLQTEFDGQKYGMLEPLLNVFRNELGLTVELVKIGWRDAFLQLMYDEIDFYGPIALSEELLRKYVTVDPFYRNYAKMISRKDRPIRSMLGLHGQRIGLLSDSVISRTMSTYMGPNGKIVAHPSIEKLMDSMRIGIIEAFATVDNAEFEILSNPSLQFEFSIENFSVDQGLISSNETLIPLANILNRYLSENPQIAVETERRRNEALLRFSMERLADEIAYIQENYNEITMYSDFVLYPLCYMENGQIKGMLPEINKVFEALTGVPIRFVTDTDYPGGITTALEKLTTGENLAIAGAYFDLDVYNNPYVEYSPVLWLETLRTYSYTDMGEELYGKTIGTTYLSSGYLGWNNTTGTPPVLYNSYKDLLAALRLREVDVALMGEMRFNYGYTILDDYNLREVSNLSAETAMHMVYGTQNPELNAVYNEAMTMFHILYPKAMNEWRALANKYKTDFIRIRSSQQIWMFIAIAVFVVLFIALAFLLRYVWESFKDEQKHNLTLQDKVYIDPLTGINNRRFLEEQLPRVIKIQSRVYSEIAVMMLDVDFFKRYNDTYGHGEGDECLKTIAEALTSCCVREDDFVARYGGEEFVIVLPYTGESGARMLASRVLTAIRECKIPHIKSDAAEVVTISIGVTSCTVEYTQTAEDYIKRADKALYMSKENGRNRYTYVEM